jgi:hypothetical protein
MYTPNQLDVYTAAYSGALAGMAISTQSQPTNASVGSYAAVAAAVQAFAQQLDTDWTSTPLGKPTVLEVETLFNASQIAWIDKGPTFVAPAFTPAAYDKTTKAIIALVEAADANFAVEGIVSPTWDAGGNPGTSLVGDGQMVFTGAMNMGSTLVDVSPATPFKPSDVGKLGIMRDAVDNVNTLPDLASSIASYISPSQVHLAQAAGANVTGKTFTWGSDSVSQWNTALASGEPITVPNEMFLFGSPVVIPSNSDITFDNPRLVAAMPTGGVTPTFAIFTAIQGSTLITSALSAPTVLGSNVIHVTVAIPKGSSIVLDANANYSMTYDVTDSTGGGLTLTLDRPVWFAALGGVRVLAVASIPRNIRMRGSWTLSGVCVRLMEFLTTRDSFIQGFNVDMLNGRPSDAAVSWDTGSYNSKYDDFVIDMGNLTNTGGGGTLESPESCEYTNGVIKNSLVNGILTAQAVKCASRWNKISGCLAGIKLDSSNAAITPTLDFVVEGGNYDGNTGPGIQLTYAENTQITGGFTTDYNGGNGIQADGTSGNGNKINGGQSQNNASGGFISLAGGGVIKIDNYSADNNPTGIDARSTIIANNISTRSCTNSGVTIASTAIGSSIDGIDTLGCNTVGIATAADSDFSHIRHEMTGNAINFSFIVNGPCTVHLTDSNFTGGPSKFGIGAVSTADAGARLYVDGVTVRMGGTASQGVYNQGGVIYLENFEASKQAGVTGSTGINGTTGTVRIGSGVNVDGANTPINAASITLNKGTFTLNGAANIDVPFADMLSTDIPKITSVDTFGVSGEMPILVSKTPGVGFRVTGTVSTSKYNWEL